jgi:hypothetical protein
LLGLLDLKTARCSDFDAAVAINGGHLLSQNNGWITPTCGSRAARRVQRTITSTAGVRDVLEMPILQAWDIMRVWRLRLSNAARLPALLF